MRTRPWMHAAIAGILGLGVASMTSAQMTVQYGIVTGIQTTEVMVDNDGVTTGGAAAVGGVLGLLSRGSTSGSRRRRGLGGAAAGALVARAARETSTAHIYSVQLLNGSSTSILTEYDGIRRGDCVSLETGPSDNVRRVSSVFCEQPSADVYPEHKEEADECDAAKQVLIDASTVEAIEEAFKQVRIVCED